jgi:hypothetical protein
MTSTASDDFPFALDYLARTFGVETPAELAVVARSLQNVRWALDNPGAVNAGGELFGFRKCVVETTVDAAERDAGCELPGARALLTPVPAKPAVKTMCFIHQAANLTPGFRLAAVRGSNGNAAFFGDRLRGETESRALLKSGWTCLFFRRRPEGDVKAGTK